MSTAIGSGAVPEKAERATSATAALAGLSAAMLLAALGTSIANVAVPSLAHAFGATFRDVQWVVIAYLLAVTCLVVGIARLGDIFGRKRVLLAGIGLFTLATALCGMAPSLWLLLVGRFTQGAGAAAMMALSMSLVSGTASRERPGSALGLLGAMSAAGTALGPVLGGLLIAAFGWRAVFLATVPAGALAFLLVWRHLPADREVPERESGGFDPAGMLLLALTLAAFALAMTLWSGFGLRNLAAVSAAAVGMALFVRSQARSSSPMIGLALLRDRTLGGGLAASALVSTVMMATLVVGPFYLSIGLGLGAASVGLMLAAAPVVVALASVPAGRLSDRFGARRVILGGLGGIAAGCGAFALLSAGSGLGAFLGSMVVVAAAYAAFQTANNSLLLSRADARQRGLVSGLLNLSRNLGLIVGASAMGAVFAAATGADDVAVAFPAAVAAGARGTFAIAAALSLAGLFAVIFSDRPFRPSLTASAPTAP